MYSLGGKEEEKREFVSSLSHRNPSGFTKREGRGGEGMYQLLISQKPLGGFTRLTDKISAPGFNKKPRIKSPLQEQIYISLTYKRKQDEFTWKRKCISSKSHGNLMDSLRREIQ